MRERRWLVSVRLTEAELAQLRELPGESDAGRLRGLLHRTALVETLERHVSAGRKGVRVELGIAV